MCSLACFGKQLYISVPNTVCVAVQLCGRWILHTVNAYVRQIAVNVFPRRSLLHRTRVSHSLCDLTLDVWVNKVISDLHSFSFTLHSLYLTVCYVYKNWLMFRVRNRCRVNKVISVLHSFSFTLHSLYLTVPYSTLLVPLPLFIYFICF